MAPALQPTVVRELIRETLTRGREFEMRALGGSMVPFIMGGDHVVLSAAHEGAITVGDIVCYAPSWGTLCLHRVITRRGGAFVVKGDAVSFTDLVTPEKMFGKVVAVERRGRRWRLDTLGARMRGRLVAVISPLLPRLIWGAMTLRRAVLRMNVHA